MSDLNIKLNLDTTAAEAAAAGVKDDLNKLKTDAERPVKISADVSAATAGASRLREALSNVQAAALGELSQKAGELGRSIGGVAGSFAEIAIKSAAAFGPVGIAITGVAAAIALAKQGFDEFETKARVSDELAGIQRNLGSAYADVRQGILTAKDAQEQLNTAIRIQQGLLNSQAALINAGYDATQINTLRDSGAALLDQIRQQGGAFQALTQRNVESMLAAKDHGAILANLGIDMQFTGNAADDLATFTALANQRAIELQRTHVSEAQTLVSQARALGNSEAATAALEAAQYNLSAEQTKLNNLIGAGNNLHTQSVAVVGSVIEVTARHNAVRATASAHSARDIEDLRIRLGLQVEEMRIAGLISNGMINAITPQERLIQLQTERNTLEHGPQTFANRTRLLTVAAEEIRLTNEQARATESVTEAARRRVQAEDQLDMTRATERKATQAAQATRDQTESNRAFAEWARNRNSTNERLNTEEEKRAQEVKDRNDSLTSSVGKLGEAQIASAFAAAAAGENAGEAMQKALKASLLALAQESAIKALYATATGLFQLATLNPAAGTTLASAAMFAGVAVAAGVGGALIPTVTAAPTGAAGGAAPRAETPNRSTGSSGEAPKNITINMNAFQSNESAQALIVRSLREAGYAGRSQVGMSTSR